MRVARSRTLAAPVADVWRVLGDPYALPRWWPLVRRVEGVSAAGWTMVLGKEGGRGVRADQRLEASEAPRAAALGAGGAGIAVRARADARRRSRRGSRRRATAAELTLELRQSPRGMARFGGFMLRRAGRRQLDEALAGMARAVET